MDSPAAILKRFGLHPKKSWGQCFLHDPSAVRRIVDCADIGASDTVVEIGAGLGTLTEELAVAAKRVIAIERDRDLAAVLRQQFSDNDKVEVAEENALTFDFTSVAGPVVVVGNLPYNISSPLLFRLVSSWRLIRAATIMMQREVVDRLVAAPGGRSYGIPSVICQQYADIRRCFSVSRGAFFPVPRVDSAVARLVMRQQPRWPCDPETFKEVVEGAFRSRRKMLKNALESKYPSGVIRDALEATSIDGRRRAEALSVEEFGKLAQALGAMREES